MAGALSEPDQRHPVRSCQDGAVEDRPVTSIAAGRADPVHVAAANEVERTFPGRGNDPAARIVQGQRGYADAEYIEARGRGYPARAENRASSSSNVVWARDGSRRSAWGKSKWAVDGFGTTTQFNPARLAAT